MYNEYKMHQHKRLYIPLNVGGVHWVLVVVDLNQNTVEYFDSMYRRRRTPAEVTKIIELFDYKLNKQLIFSVVRGPQQQNGYDCGVFTCMIALFHSQGVPLSILVQKDMPLYRRTIARDILRSKIRV
jgi:sentrin-specific protease 1